ncbi:ATP-dependent nuclease [Chitinophaga sp. NPDC101104]|uniref:ATP-dependent nuclease n=1 Tax=Chitinophaga sp. NPDC101104 TaxID=3390561 RepID=UPI003D090C5B
MQLISLEITNFRSFGPQTQILNFNKKLSAFVGHNSSGKTVALEALRKLFGNRIERNLSKEDFHIPPGEDSLKPTPKTLILIADLNFLDDETGVEEFGEDFVIATNGGVPFVRIKLEATWTPSSISLEGEIEAKHFILSELGDAGQDDTWKDFPREKHGLFQLMYVPALRKTADQIRYASGSILHQLMRTVSFTQEFREQVREQVQGLNQLVSDLPGFTSIQRTLQGTWQQFHKDHRFSEATMNFGAGELDEIMRKIDMEFSPALGQHRRFGIDDLGDGYRSLFYITLVCALLKVQQDSWLLDDEIHPVLTILAIEEPENHIAPQLLGRVLRILKEISGQPRVQLMLSSHTPAIIKRIDPESILHFRLTDEFTSEVNFIELPDTTDTAYKYVKEAVQNFPEIYFAKLVVIGEGDTEDVIFRHMMKVLNTDFDENSVSFAPLGHRFVHHIWRLLYRLNIPHITILDLDLGRPDAGWNRIHYAIQELLANGVDRSSLLATSSGELSEDSFNQMPDWSYNGNWETAITAWRGRLTEHGVYFSGKLDLDFLMLQAFENYYTATTLLPQGGGPRIPNAGTPEYMTYVEGAAKATLKTDNIIDGLYSTSEFHQMIWYRYHFLNRGKPGTHIEVLSTIPDETFRENVPAELTAIFDHISNLIEPNGEDLT